MSRRALGSAVVIAALVSVGAFYLLSADPIPQPMEFNHQKHVDDLGMDCTDCHLYAESGMRATIPNISICSDCHDEVMTESPEEVKLLEFVEAGERIPWRKVYWAPDHVFFSHRRHTTVAEIECSTCHGAMEGRTRSVTRQAVRITMKRCMTCHTETGASNDCIACHR